jgi:transcriptional regulator with XRE-family HTH domain
MAGSFGARLRQRREAEGISLVTIAEQTKIKRSLLDELEQDDVRHWPAGFFGRAFIRAYAQAIGLNPDVVVKEFLEAHPEPVEVVATVPAPPADTGLRSIVGSALVGSLGRLRRTSAPAPTIAPAAVANDAVERAEPAATSSDIDFDEVARLCTAIARVQTTDDLRALLQQAGDLLDATGIILWVWDEPSAELKPALAHGYSDQVLAQLPAVTRDTNNATAAAFRSQELCTIDPTERARGALAVPLLTPAGCAGVLAIELQRGAERTRSLGAAATILAAVLAQLIAG